MGIVEQVSKRSIYQRVRTAEASYLPVVLRKTLQESRHWGAVRVIPEVDPTSEILITAKILESNALELSIKIHVVDASGVIWLDRVYTDTSTDHGYGYGTGFDAGVESDGLKEPFQDLYNEIANDMFRVLASKDDKQISRILDMSTLRYAIALSPKSFSGYLEVSTDGTMLVSGLPARNDKMYERAIKIRESEYRFIDVMDQQYDSFFTKMQRVYPYWRQYSYELMVYNSELERSGSGKRRNNTWAILEDVYRTYQEFKLNEDALRELSVSFESEMKPTEAELEGRVVELSGTLHDQYNDWRELLREFYTLERNEPGG
jgi:hypothetical protein